jgi:hypothetical protein
LTEEEIRVAEGKVSMKKADIRYWALQVIERVKNGEPNEDTYTELKSEWIEPKKAARQIAGHANAARGEPILWLIGVDEEKGIVGAEHNELSEWFAQVQSCFIDEHPDLIHLNISEDGFTIVILYFETDDPPYLIKNPNYGEKDGGPIRFEVPWREATSTRTANKKDLIKLLVPIARKPLTDITTATVQTIHKPSGRFDWTLEVNISIYPRKDDIIIFSPKNTSVSFITGDEQVFLNDIQLYPPPGVDNIYVIYKNVSIKGPSIFAIRCKGSSYLETLGSQGYWQDGIIHISLTSIDSEIALTERVNVKFLPDVAAKTEGKRLEWCFEEGV